MIFSDECLLRYRLRESPKAIGNISSKTYFRFRKYMSLQSRRSLLKIQ